MDNPYSGTPLSKGQLVQRTYVRHPDRGDGFINILCGALFQITEVTDYNIACICIASAGYPPTGGSEWLIPIQHLEEPYYVVGKEHTDHDR